MDLENPAPELAKNNPLGKVPTLVADDGAVYYDSPVICEYLAGQVEEPKLFPSNGPERWTAIRRMALADGILDALTARRHETIHRAKHEQSQSSMEKQKAKSDRGLAALEQEVDLLGSDVTIGHVAIACCLGYLDFRFAGEPWRQTHPKLAKWYEEFSKRPSITQTMPPAGGH